MDAKRTALASFFVNYYFTHVCSTPLIIPSAFRRTSLRYISVVEEVTNTIGKGKVFRKYAQKL